MVVIVIAVITQGFRVPHESRGDFKGLIFVNSGFFQAVGVISFGVFSIFHRERTCANYFFSICLPYVYNTHLCTISNSCIDHNSLLIYGSLKKPTLDRFALVTHYSTGVSMFMCLAMALAGFLSFGSKTQGNVLNNFPSDNIIVNVARL